MGYLDIWFFNSRPRMKVFLCYFLIFLALFIFSDVMIYLFTKSLYQPIENYEIQESILQVTLSQAEASNTNGNIKGNIKNNTNEEITNQYLKIDFYTPRNVNIGTKYIKIDNLQKDEERKFEMGFSYDNVSNIKVSVVNSEQAGNITEEQLKSEPIYGPKSLFGITITGLLFS